MYIDFLTFKSCRGNRSYPTSQAGCHKMKETIKQKVEALILTGQWSEILWE